MQINAQASYAGPVTHEWGIASRITKTQELERSVMSTLLWEDGFYEDGKTIAERIFSLVAEVPNEESKRIMIKAKVESRLRHAPLLIAIGRVKAGYLKADELPMILDRVDSIPEFLAMYWAQGEHSLDHQFKKGIAIALKKFNEYQFAKYDRPKAVKLRDVFRIIRPKPENDEQSELWKKVVKGELSTPDTWETQLSSGADKKETFTRLILEKKLGDLAFLRNLRGMSEAGVDPLIIRGSFAERRWSGILATQFIAAAKYAPTFEDVIEVAMFKALEQEKRLSGRIALLVDVSGSMDYPLSSKSEMRRIEAASALAMMIRDVSSAEIFVFWDKVSQVAPRRGFALRDAIGNPHGGTRLWEAVGAVGKFGVWDKMIVISDEQTADIRNIKFPAKKFCMINVGNSKNGVGYGEEVLHIDGWSDSVVKYISEIWAD